ncbi:peptidase [Campylobacterota bacterium]|nr:peptidase [Campylobacterota bacterium]
MKRLLEIFEALNRTKRGSGDSAEAFRFLVDFCERSGAQTQSDRAHNILAIVGDGGRICLQAHYDMVALGDQPPTIKRDGDWLHAANGTLGADNGIGVALMLTLIAQGRAGEYLFTSDEEIGLNGARALEALPKAKMLLNLDSETEGEITIGCAGGADYTLTRSLKEIAIDHTRFRAVKITAKGCEGGHSGVDIDRGIASALVEICRTAKEHGGSLISLDGGERNNAIARNATAVALFAIDTVLRETKHTTIEPIQTPKTAYALDETLTAALAAVPHGVISRDPRYSVVERSCNFARAQTDYDRLTLTLFARGNSPDALEANDAVIALFAANNGFDLRCDGRYSSWQPKESLFAKEIEAVMRSERVAPKYGVIHAGLECGVLGEKLPSVQMVSIGPTIEAPHSYGERVFVPSIDRLLRVVQLLL